MTTLDLRYLEQKDSTTMYTDLLIQQIHIAHIESNRRNDVMRNEQLRIARMTRPSLMALISHRIGMMLISIGERLHQEPVVRSQAHLERLSTTRAA
jgi:hypothetical protein